MQPNLAETLYSIIGFGLVLGISFLVFRLYRKSSRKSHKALDKLVHRYNIFKSVFIVGALYFSGYIILQHTNIACDELELEAQCQCYALEMIDHDDISQKWHWAHNGTRMCPKSTFFSDYLAKNPIK